MTPDEARPPEREARETREGLALAVQYRFEAVEGRVAKLERELEGLEGAKAARDDINELKDEVGKMRDGVTQIIRASRADTLKYVAFTIGPAMLAAAAIGVALLTGNVPDKP